MSAQIRFFRKSYIDLDLGDDVTITITDSVASNNGQDYVDYLRNRKNDSGWITTGSTDAANSTLEVDFGSEVDITDILLVLHNFKAYTIQYYDGASYQDFSTSIAETTNTETTNHHSFTSVSASKIKIIITACQTVDADKILRQLIVTSSIGSGQLEGWPEIKTPMQALNKKVNKMLSGKVSINENIGYFSASLEVKHWNSDNDLDIVEEIYFSHRGVLIWPCGGDEDQFSTTRIGYRKEDIYLVRPVDEYSPEYVKGVYTSGLKIKMKLQEAIR